MSAQILNQKIDDIVDSINRKTKIQPEIGLILGSGLGSIADNIESDVVIPYSEIPHIPSSNTPGHIGQLVIGRLDGKNFITMQGRIHLYEGHTPHTSTLLVRAMKKLGVNTLFITGAAGGLNYHFHAGEVMLITDHINFTGHTPLLGDNLANFGPRFCNMFDIYTNSLQKIAIKVAIENRVQLCQGVYAGILGPQYATRAELRFLLQNNCDAVGMSVVQEAIIAAHSSMQILGLAAITDMALPYSARHAAESDVIEQAKLASAKMQILITEIARAL